jgi:hypothetical protein
MNDLIWCASAKCEGLSYRFVRQRCGGEIGNELNELKKNGVRSSSYKFVVDVIVVFVVFELDRASYMKLFGMIFPFLSKSRGINPPPVIILKIRVSLMNNLIFRLELDGIKFDQVL